MREFEFAPGLYLRNHSGQNFVADLSVGERALPLHFYLGNVTRQTSIQTIEHGLARGHFSEGGADGMGPAIVETVLLRQHHIEDRDLLENLSPLERVIGYRKAPTGRRVKSFALRGHASPHVLVVWRALEGERLEVLCPWGPPTST